MQIVVAQQEYDLVRVSLIEIEDDLKLVEGIERADMFLGIRVNIVTEEDDLVKILVVFLGIMPERASVDIGNNQNLMVHFTYDFYFVCKCNTFLAEAL